MTGPPSTKTQLWREGVRGRVMSAVSGETGSTRTNQQQKPLCLPAPQNTLALFPPFVCLPHSAGASVSLPRLRLTTMPRVCASAHTPEYHSGTLGTSIISLGQCRPAGRPPARPRVVSPHPSFVCHFLISTMCVYVTAASPGGSCSRGRGRTIHTTVTCVVWEMEVVGVSFQGHGGV